MRAWKWKIVISKGDHTYFFQIQGGGGVLGNLDESLLLGVARSQGVAKAMTRRCQGVAKALPRRYYGDVTMGRCHGYVQGVIFVLESAY